MLLLSHTYSTPEDYTITVTGGSGYCAFTYLYCSNNQLTSLDVSKNTDLTNLSCENNQLTALDVSKNTALTYLECRDNAIPLSDSYAASQKISNPENKYLGTQRLPAVNTGTNVAVVADNVFNGVGTVFTVKKNYTTAVEGTDYSLSGGEITFLKEGTYSVEISNPAITSHKNYPAKVIANYNHDYVEISAIYLETQMYVANHTLYIHSAAIETVNIYSVAGTLLYSKEKGLGTAVIPLNTQERILIVKGSSGWVKKISY
jgi:hypothetical protein